MAAVSFAEPLVPSELLQLTKAVGKQHVRQLLLSKAWHVLWLLQLQLSLRGASHPAGGRYIGGLLS